MNTRTGESLARLLMIVLLVAIATGCANEDGGVSLQDIPRYPDATEGESMAQTSPGGILGGKLEQFTTTDSFDEVVEFYTYALTQYEPKYLSHTSELGRQTAMSIRKKDGVITVAIQAFPQEGIVNITLMSIGN